jgi:hypothetical protein
MDLSFTISSGPRHYSHSQVRVPRDSWVHFTLSDSILLQRGRRCSRIYIPQEQGGSVIDPDTGSLFVASYDSQGYGRDIRTRLHMVGLGSWLWSLEADPTETPFRNNLFIVDCIFVAAGKCLPSLWQTMDIYCGSTIPAFRRHVIILSSHMIPGCLCGSLLLIFL